MDKKNTAFIYYFLVVFTGVVIVAGEQGVDKLKNATNKPHTVSIKEDSVPNLNTRNKRQDNQGDDEDQCSTVIRGHDGRDGRDGQQGLTGASGPQGPKGSEGPAGVKGEKGERGSSGATYVRWGRTVCPPGAERIYSGKAGGSKYDLGGGTDQTLCMPNDPEYFPGDTLTNQDGTLWGISYLIFTSTSSAPLNKRGGLQMPCAVCFVNKSTIFTMPAKYTCPTGWTLEYNGYLMSEYTTPNRPRKDTICADRIGESAGAYTPYPSVNYLMNVHCDEGLVCPPYAASKPLTCAVCSK